MQFTVKDVIEIDVMNQARVRSSENTLSSKTVESVSVMEIPVENFVRKNELVLSAGIGCGEDTQTFMDFVQDIYLSEAAALVISTGRHVFDIPEEIIAFANRVEFPIIEIPWEVRFSDITRSVLSQLHHWQRHILKQSEELQKQLLHLFLSGANLSQAAEVIGQVIETPVIITDKEGALKGKSKNATPLIEKWKQHALSISNPEVLNPLQIPIENMGEDIQLVDNSIIKTNIQSLHSVGGYLLIMLPPNTSAVSFFANRQENLLEHAITSVALWFQRENAIRETEMRLKDDFVLMLAKGETDSWDMVMARAKSLDLNLDLPYVCILGSPENLKHLFKKKTLQNTTYEHWLPDTIRQIEDMIEKSGLELQLHTMSTYHKKRFIIFLEVPMETINETIKTYLDHLESKLQKLLPELTMSWGIGENHAGVKTFHESFNDARIAFEIGTRQKGPGHRSTYASTSIYRALHSIVKNPDMQELTLSTIGALIDYDNQRGLDLVNTLIVYIRNQGNTSQASRVLKLHRQSLIYRLKKIESLTNRSLEDPEDLFLLNLSIKLWMVGASPDSH